MNRRVVAAVVAGVLAIATFIAMFIWGSGAESRAMANVKTQTVYTVVSAIPKGTLGSALGDKIKKTDFPAVAVPSGAVTDLTKIANQLAAVDLIPGDVIVAARFIDKAKASSSTVEIPKGMEQISLLVSPAQVRGGVVQAGDKVAIIATIDATTGPGASTSGITVGSKAVTQQVMSHLLVTAVQGGSGASTNATTATPAKGAVVTGSVMVTIAVSVGDAEKIIWVQSQAKIYLAVETADTDISTSNSATGADVFNR